MPYTPPSQHSPATSGVTSPVSNGLQLHERATSPGSPQRPSTSPGHGRPSVPRSGSSAGYLSRPRRSSSWNEHDPHKLYTVENSRPSSSQSAGSHESASSIQQSPSPVSDSAMPPGAIISPPDSTQNSSDDDESPPGTSSSRQVEGIEELQKAIHSSFHINKTPSSPPNGLAESSSSSAAPPPSSSNRFLKLVLPDDDSTGTSSKPARLSPSARKISHSRSATETSFFDMRSSSLQNSQTTSDDSDEDLDPSLPKPPLLRKKSGELVKPAIRPSSRRKHMSVPGTPTYSKAVHFNDNIEQVRHFLQVDRPIAVSAGASPAEAYEEESEFPFGKNTGSDSSPSSSSSGGSRKDGRLDIKLANFPRQTHERLALPIRVEKICLSADQKSLIGATAVANLAFHKSVVARFTFDYWKTTSEVVAEYNNDIRQEPRTDGYDQFKFSIKLTDLTNLESKTLLLCVRYQVNNTEYWDNNDAMNFQVDFTRTKPQQAEKPAAAAAATTTTATAASVVPEHSSSPGLGSRPLPRSKHSSGASPRPRSMPSFDDDFASSLDSSSLLKFRNRPSSYPEASNRKPSTNNGQPFASRYDFGASLSAALSQAQAQLGDRSGIRSDEPEKAAGSSSSSSSSSNGAAQTLARSGITAPTNSGADSPRPDALLANNQTLDSRAYQEFVSKFCFFGSSAKSSPQSVPLPYPPPSQQQQQQQQQQTQKLPGGTDGAQDDSPMSTGHYTYFPPQQNESPSNGSGYDGGYFNTASSFLSTSHLDDTLSSYPRSIPPVFHHTAAGHTLEALGRAGSPVNSFGYPYVREYQQSMFGSEPHAPQVIQG